MDQRRDSPRLFRGNINEMVLTLCIVQVKDDDEEEGEEGEEEEEEEKDRRELQIALWSGLLVTHNTIALLAFFLL